MTLNRWLYGGWENLCTGFGDLFRKAAILYHLGNLISGYPSLCFYEGQMTTEEDDVLFCFVLPGQVFPGTPWPIFLNLCLPL